jgi:AraC-like DNA-binding protein
MKGFNKNILIISDIENHKNTIASILLKERYTVFHVSSITDDFEHFGEIDLTIIDCIETFDLLDSVMKEERLKAASLAVVRSAYGAREHVFSLGAGDYVVSPIISSELLARVKSSLCCLDVVPAEEHLNLLKNAEQAYEHRAYSASDISYRERELIKKVCAYMLSDLDAKHSLESLAYAMGTNRNKIAQASKNVLGVGIHCWLVAERMKEGKRLCMTTDLPIQEVSYRVGYSNPESFSTAFKRHFNMSPRQCRNVNI